MRFVVAGVLIMAATACATAPRRTADLILSGGSIYTGPGQRAEAVAIRGQRIVAVGSDAEISLFAGADTRRIDLAGRLVIPGINDAHIHAPWPTSGSEHVAIPESANSRRSFLQALKEEVDRAESRSFIVAALPLPLVDESITRDDLDAISSTQPIRVTVFGGHSAILNTPALREWEIGEDEADPPGGWYGRTNGRLNGWLYEHAYWVPQVRRAAGASDAELREAVRNFEQEALQYGITSVQTMSVIPTDRLEQILTTVPTRLHWRLIDFRMAPWRQTSGTKPVKYILDGTPMERSIALREPYADASNVTGSLNYSEVEIAGMVRAAAAGQQQLLVHAVGDRTIDRLLSEMELIDADWPALRVRIEHGDLLTPDLAQRARALGVVLVQNPAHFTIPEMMTRRLGQERVATLQPARSLVEGGLRFALGSDGPVNPFLNMFFAAIHPTNPSESLTIDQSLAAYTAGSAFAEFTEEEKGRIAPGLLADLAVLSQDIFAIAPPELPHTTSLTTIVNGEIAWEAEGASSGASQRPSS